LQKVVYYDNEIIEKTYGTICNNDYFSYYKANLILIATVLSVLAVYRKFLVKKPILKQYSIFILLAIFGACNILSALFSGFMRLSFIGAPDRYEGANIWVAYCVIAFCTAILIDQEDRLKAIVNAFLFSIFGVCVIGGLQAFGLNLLSSKVGRILITLFSAEHDIHMGLDSRIYSTLYNANVMGTFTAMAFVMELTLMIFEENKRRKIGLSLLSALVFLNLLCNYSRLAYLGAIVGSVIIIIIGYKTIIKHPIHSIMMLVTYLSIAICINIYSDGMLSGRVYSLVYEASTVNNEKDDLEDIVMDKEAIKLVFSDQEFNMVYNTQTQRLDFFDKNNMPIAYIYDKETSEVIFEQQDYKEYQLFFRDNGVINLTARGFKMTFRYIEDHFVFADTNRLIDYKAEDISYRAEKWFFGLDISDQAGSGRGYIWSRTVPLLKKAMFLGYGPDTFALHFPQQDYVAKLKTRGIGLSIVDKPHNMYLQIAMGSGVISLVVFLIFVGIYTITLFLSCVRYFNKNNHYNCYAIVALMSLSAVIAYLVSTLFNDSTVSTAGYFWVMIGLGIVCTIKMQDKEKGSS
jgi:hypothetical protein